MSESVPPFRNDPPPRSHTRRLLEAMGKEAAKQAQDAATPEERVRKRKVLTDTNTEWIDLVRHGEPEQP